MKKLIKFIKKLYNNLPWVKARARALCNVKWAVRVYFEGFDTEPASAPTPMCVKDLGIFDIKIRRLNPILEIEIHLDRPGLLIGKGEATYDELKKYLSRCFDQPIKINIIEVKFW